MNNKKANKKIKIEKKESISAKKSKKIFTTDILDALSNVTKTEKGKTYTILGTTFIVFAILILFAIRPTIKTIVELDKKIKEYKTTAKALDEKYNALQGLKAQYETPSSDGGYKEAIELVDKRLVPDTPQIPLTVANIDALATENSVTISDVVFKEDVAEKRKSVSGAKRADIQLSASGTENDVITWLEKIEEYPRPIVINSLSLEAEDSDTEATESEVSSNYTVRATLTIYYID